jgi:hypothetical protein
MGWVMHCIYAFAIYIFLDLFIHMLFSAFGHAIALVRLEGLALGTIVPVS